MQFPIFQSVEGFGHALSTRHGGVSSGEFGSLNLGLHVGDDADKVVENRTLWAREIGFDAARLVAAGQTHGKTVRVVSTSEAGRGSVEFSSALPGCDALLTNEKQVPLLILVADCAPILLVDPQRRVCAVVHAGWRGALAGVTGQAIQAMNSEFGTRPQDVLAAIGPCLSVANLEVGEEVAALVEHKEPRAVVRANFQRPHLDLRALVQFDLAGHGVLPSNIEISPFCPKERNDLFFSHRGQNGRAGRFGLVAWWE